MQIEPEFQRTLNTSTWMSDKVKAYALKKASRVRRRSCLRFARL